MNKQRLIDLVEAGIRDMPDQEGGFSFGAERSPKQFQKYVEEYADEPIDEAVVCRKPLPKIFEKLGNILTRGQLKRNMVKLNYDEFYHLYVYIKLRNGVKFLLEKNEIINVIPNAQPDPGRDGACMGVPKLYKSDTTFGEFIEKGIERAGVKQFFDYAAHDNNCQKFIENLLQANNVAFPRMSAFVMQDVAKAIPQSWIQSALKKVTDIARAIYWITGKKVR